MSRPAAGNRSRSRRRRRQAGLMRLAVLLAVLAAAIAAAFSLTGGAPSAETIATNFATDWAHRDWRGLYRAVDQETRLTVPYGQFAGDYERAYATATVTRARALRDVRAVGGSELVTMRIHTRLFGTLHEQFVLPLTDAGGERIIWHQNLAFPGLFPGETVHRSVTTPSRGVLLARTGAALANYSSAAGLIGSVGIASGSQLTHIESHGFPPTAQAGLDGLEYVFQDRLAGRPGGELFAGTRVIGRARPLAGSDVKTSIDPELQNYTTAAFDAAGTTGGAVLMDPRNGQLLALAGSPLEETQPPGSTFKIVTTTAVLEAGLATIDSTFPYATYAVIDGYQLHNSDGERCGGTLLNAFAVSCNSVYAPLGVKLGAARLVSTAQRFGFDSLSPVPIAAPSTIPLPGEIPDAVALGSTAIGQYQDLASPLQMLRVAATIALGGREPVPTFALAQRPRFPRIMPASVAATIRTMMIAVVNSSTGTGVAARLAGVVVAGKTGTAQLTVPACQTGPTGPSGDTGVSAATAATGATGPCANIPNNPYNTDAWFVAFAPAYRPKIAVAVLLDHDGAGGTSAAPLARDLMAQALQLGY